MINKCLIFKCDPASVFINQRRLIAITIGLQNSLWYNTCYLNLLFIFTGLIDRNLIYMVGLFYIYLAWPSVSSERHQYNNKIWHLEVIQQRIQIINSLSKTSYYSNKKDSKYYFLDNPLLPNVLSHFH